MPQLRRTSPQWSGATSDEELVALAQRGQREAFGVLYDRYLPRVYGYCYRLLEEREAAEDANTDVFMRALTALPAYRAGTETVAELRRKHPPEKVLPVLYGCEGLVDVVTVRKALNATA